MFIGLGLTLSQTSGAGGSDRTYVSPDGGQFYVSPDSVYFYTS